MSMTLFVEQLRYITAVTEALNALEVNDEHFYVHVELREEGTHRKVGEWSDEIAGDAWYFNETEEKSA